MANTSYKRRPKAVLKNSCPTVDLSEFNAPESPIVEKRVETEVTYKVYLEAESASWTIQDDMSILAHIRKITWAEKDGQRVQRLFMDYMSDEQFLDFVEYLATDGKYLKKSFTPYYWVETRRGDKVVYSELTLLET